MESENLEYKTVKEFLTDLKKEFREGDEEIIQVIELKKLEQGGKTIKEFVQEFRRAVRESRYERWLLIEEFKHSINSIILQRLIESECQPSTINQWYEWAINLDRNWRENKRDEERL